MSTPRNERTLVDLSTLGIPDIRMLGRYRYAAAHPALLRHAHRGVFEIAFLERGRQLYSFGDGEHHSLRGGEAIVAWPDEPHSTGDWPEFPGTLYWLQCRFPRPGGRLLGLSPAETAELMEALRHLPRCFRAPKELRRMFEGLIETARTPSPLRAPRLRAQIVNLLLSVAEAEEPGSARLPRTLADVLGWLPGQLDRKLATRELARKAGMSESYFKTQFRSALGCPPGEFIRLLRLRKASVALRETRASITEIALSLGFASSQHFAGAFRRHFRCSPLEYRRKEGAGATAPALLEGTGVSFHPAAD